MNRLALMLLVTKLLVLGPGCTSKPTFSNSPEGFYQKGLYYKAENERESIKLFSKACMERHYEACYEFANSLKAYSDKDQLNYLLKISCENGVKKACPSQSNNKTISPIGETSKNAYEPNEAWGRLLRDLLAPALK